jgi:hypothetical protein
MSEIIRHLNRLAYNIHANGWADSCVKEAMYEIASIESQLSAAQGEVARLSKLLSIAADALQDISVGQLVNNHYKTIAKRALNFMCQALGGGE